MVSIFYLVIFSQFSSSFWSSCISYSRLYIFSSISSVSLLLTMLYHLYHYRKLLIITWSIIEKKINKFKTLEVTVLVAVIIITWVSKTFSSISSISSLLTLLYHFHCNCKLLKIIWSIIEKKADKFKIFGVAVAAAVAKITWVFITFSSISSG